MSNIIGIRNNNTIVPLSAATKRTKVITLAMTTDITYTGTGATLTGKTLHFGYAVFYADSTGKWRMTFNIGAVFDSASNLTGITLTFAKTSVQFAASQSIHGFWSGNTVAKRSYCVVDTGNLILESASAITTGGGFISGDVELKQEPTEYTTAANMEGVTAVDVYIPPASAGIIGLVNNLAGNTAGTPILGKNDGVVVASGYVGEKISSSCTTTTSVSSTTDTDVTGMSINITKGVWLIGYNVCSAVYNNSGGTANVFGRTRITDSSNNPLSETESFFGADSIANTTAIYSTSSRTTVINISSDKTYKLRLCGTDTNKAAYVYSTSMVGAFTDPDNTSIIWAIRIA